MLEGLNLSNLNVDDNGRVSFSGLSSGIDLEGTVDAIIAARRIPVDSLETTVETNKEKITALKDLRTVLESLRSSMSKLYGQVSFGNNNDIFAAKQAFASSSRIDGQTASAAGNLIGVTVNNSATAGNHTVEILKTAKAHKVSSDEISDKSASLGFADTDEFSIDTNQAKTSFQSAIASAGTDTLGSDGTLQFTDDEGNIIGTVAYLSTDTLDDFATAIEAAVTGVTAEVEATSSGVRLKLASSEAFRMEETGAGSVRSDFELGISKIAVTSSTSLLDLRDLINQANKGATATGVGASVVTVTASESYLVLTSKTGVTMTLANTSGTPLDTVGILDGADAIKNELQAAQYAQLYADGIKDQSGENYESDFQTSSAVTVGSAGTLSFDAGALGTVNYTANTTLQELADDITANITGVTAEVVTDGAGVRLQITGSPAYAITETGGGTALTDLGIDKARKVIERSTNTITDLFAGVTLSLFAAEQGTEISLDIEQDLSQVKEAVVSFVEAYNAFRQFYNGQRLRDEKTGVLDEQAGVLAKSVALEQVASSLSQIIGTGVEGVDESFTVLSQVGVNFVNINQEDPLLAENLEIDEATLDAALLSNAEDVRKLFGFDLTVSNPNISLLNFTGDTQYVEGGYTLNLQPGTGDNALLYSEEADNAYWTATNTAVSANATTAPNGQATADGLVGDATNTTHYLATTAAESFTNGSSYIFSTYLKAGDVTEARIAVNGNAFGGAIGAEFDLSGGAVNSTDAGIEQANIEDVGDGWYRVSIKATAVADDTADVEIYSMDAGSTTFTGDGATANTYVWGSQIEEVTTATSPGAYAQTTTAAVTGANATANVDGDATGLDDGSASVSSSGVITVLSGNAKGLQLFFSGLSSVTSAQIDLTVGLGAQMYFKIGALLDTTTGIVEGEIDELTDQNEVHNERITEMLDRLEIQRQNLLERYISMETALATANRIMESVRQQTEALTKNGS